MIARWLVVAGLGLCLVVGTGGCRPKNKQTGSTTQTAAKPKRTWWGLGPPKKPPTTAQAAVKTNDGSKFKSEAQTPRQAVVHSDPPPHTTVAQANTSTSTEPKPAKRGWFGFGSKKDHGPAYVAEGERVETDMAEPVTIDVLANEGASAKNLDLDKITKGPTNGTARIHEGKNARGEKVDMIVYTPNRKFSGDDQIKYLVERGNEKSEATATVHVRQRGDLRFSAVIDHKDVVMIRGNEMWFRHKYGAAPTQVMINGKPADPKYREEGVLASGDSAKMSFAPGMPTDKPFKVSATGGPGSEAELLIVEEPKAENNYTTTLMLSDPREGTRKWDVVVRFEAE